MHHIDGKTAKAGFGRFLIAPLMALAALLPATFAAAAVPSPRGLERFVQAELDKTGAPAASIAVIHNGRLVWSGTIGAAQVAPRRRADSRTLFQAASISKAFTAVAALRLVEEGRLSLDGDVNSVLRGWKLRDGDGNLVAGVSLRMLLSHTAGASISGLRGYDQGEAVPALDMILDGRPPANNVPVRIVSSPGAQWRYSGGGYLVIQRMIEDVTGRPLAAYLNETVLRPLEMRDSIFAQPPPGALAQRTAAGYLDDGTAVPGGARTYPETAAAGLWTTAADLAKFVLAMQRSLAGRSDGLLSPAMAREAVREQRNHMGLGFFLQGEGRSLRFDHSGRNQGFDSEMIGYADRGDGAVIMMNANDSAGMLDRTLQYIGGLYDWPDYPRLPVAPRAGVRLSPAQARRLEGHYEAPDGRLVTLIRRGGALVLRRGAGRGAYYDALIPLGADVFAGSDHPARYTFRSDPSGDVVAMAKVGPTGNRQDYPRIGPTASRRRGRDGDTEQTARLVGMLRALADNPSGADRIAGLSPGFARDVGSARVQELNGIVSLQLAGAETVAGRNIVRHATPVARTLLYTVGTGPGSIIIYLAEDGSLADYDLVDR